MTPLAAISWHRRYRALGGWDVARSTPVSEEVVRGFATTPPGTSPSDEIYTRACADPACLYRILDVRLFDSLHELFLAHIIDPTDHSARGISSKFRHTRADVWEVSFRRAIKLADLRGAVISQRVPMVPATLKGAELSSVQCEVVRAIKDRLAVDALRLPCSPGERGQYLAIYLDAWAAEAEETDLGPLQDQPDVANWLSS
jgi:hypothetical protein